MSEGDQLSFHTVLDAWDSAFSNGDIESFAAILADDVQLMWHFHDTTTGKGDVVESFRGLFASTDTSAWRADHHTVEVHEDAAYVLSDFTEDLLPFDGSPGTRVSGRAVVFFRKEGGLWLITRVLSARSAPDQRIAR